MLKRYNSWNGEEVMGNTADLLGRIEEKYQHMSKGYKRIAGYIVQNYDKAAFMTANRLGERAGVSESTVVRFADSLGYDGYPQLQKAIQEMIRNKLTTVPDDRNVSGDEGRRGSGQGAQGRHGEYP